MLDLSPEAQKEHEAELAEAAEYNPAIAAAVLYFRDDKDRYIFSLERALISMSNIRKMNVADIRQLENREMDREIDRRIGIKPNGLLSKILRLLP